MIWALYLVLAEPQAYRFIWRDGELYIEPRSWAGKREAPLA